MNEKQLENITKLLMLIPSQMCRKIGREVSKLVFEQIGQNLAIYHLMILKVIQDEGAEHVTEVGNIVTIYDNLATPFRREDTGNNIKQSSFSSTIAANNGNIVLSVDI